MAGVAGTSSRSDPDLEFSAALVADLGMLTEALDDPGIDVAETFRLVARDALLAVRSFIGLSVLIGIAARQATLTAFELTYGPADIGASLMVPLPLGRHPSSADSPSDTEIALVLYASTPGAFVDLAADLRWLGADSRPGLEGISLDRHRYLTPSEPTSSLGELTVVNQAIGALIGDGRTPEEAERKLFLDAARDGGDVVSAAAAVLAQLDPQPDPA
jgi:hypothetical protein